MDWKPICHPSPAKNKILIFGLTFSFWWLAGLVIELKPHLPPLSSQKNKMLIFGLHLNSDDWPGRSMDSNPVHHPSPVKKKLNAWLQPHLPPLSSQKNKMLIFGLRSTSDDRPGWSMDSNPVRHPSPAKIIKCSFLDYIQLLMIRLGWSMDSKPIHQPSPAIKIKCSFLDYVQLLMIGWAGWWTWTLSATPLQSRK